jgi:Flp pilus assembly pilin Flp
LDVKDSVMRQQFEKWWREEDGQDLIEYGLLCSFIAFAAVVAVNLVSAAMNNTYGSWDDAVKDLWEVPDPEPVP